MLFIVAILLAIFVLEPPWQLIVVAVAAVIETAETFAGIWWSNRRRAQAGAEAMIGATVSVRSECRPTGTVSFKGELWRARCAAGAAVGERVRVQALEDLTLVVEPTEELSPNARG